MKKERAYPPPLAWRKLQNVLARQAMKKKNIEGLEKALKRGADPNAVFSTHPRAAYCKQTHLLHAAVEKRWVQGIKVLLDHGAEIELRSGLLHATPLFIAAEDRALKTMRVLVQAGACIHGKGWAVNQARIDELTNLLGWDYPGQSDWVEYHEITALDLVKQNKDPEERREIISGVSDRTTKKERSSPPLPML